MEIKAEPYDRPVAGGLVAALLVDLNGRYGPGDFPPIDPATFAPPGGIFLVARVSGEPAACGGFKRIDDDVAEVKRMFVVPDHRGRGLARAILTALETHARAAGYTSLRLETGVLQPEAIALYRSSGWEPVPCFPPYDKDEDSVCFAKRL